MKLNRNILVLMGILLLAIPQSFAQEDVQELVGARGGGDAVLNRKGYTHVKTDKSNTNSYAYWWRQRTKTCICVRTADGRIESIYRTRLADCNKNSSNAKLDNANVDLEKAFDRGHNEGVLNKGYNNVYDGERMREAYARGYTSGVKARTGKPKNNYVEVHDLNGWLASSAYDVLRKRGFKELRSNVFNGMTHKYWHHSRTGQCIESLQRGRDISEIRPFKNCNQYLGAKEEPSFIEWKDLIGKDAESSYKTLEKRGFKELKIAHTDGTTRRIFHHSRTGQCIVTISVSKRIRKIEPSDNCNKYM